jgi:hypothetical protein
MREADDLIERFKAKKADLRCRVCGNSEFTVFVTSDDAQKTFFHVQGMSSGSRAVDTKFRTVSTGCTNCGHIEQFLMDFLLDKELGTSR